MLVGILGPLLLWSPGLVRIVVLSLPFIGGAAVKVILSCLSGAWNRAWTTMLLYRYFKDFGRPWRVCPCGEDPEAQPSGLWT